MNASHSSSSPTLSRTSAEGGALHRPAVLVVEDDDDVRAEVVDLLRERGYDVTEANDGLQGLSMLRAAPVDVVVLDLWLPHMDGWSFRAEQRADSAISDIPVIVMTADDTPQARAIDASAVLRKPFDADALCTQIRSVLAERGQEARGATNRVSEAVALLVNAVGHEVANPLMTLISGLERARKETRVGVDAVDMDQLLDQCWRIAHSLRTLRGLPCPAWTRDGDINLVEVMRAAILRTGGEDVRILFEPGEPSWVRGDSMVVLYLCTALLKNAVEAVPRFSVGVGSAPSNLPHVAVRVFRTGGEVCLEVRDPGAPIPADELSRIFDLDTPGRERAWGAGLRLWFVRQIVEALGGIIEISNVDDGVRCRVRLPARETEEGRTNDEPRSHAGHTGR